MKFVKYISILLTVILSACLHDDNRLCSPEGNGRIIIQIQMPNLMQGTRVAISPDNTAEYYVEHIDVLVFNGDTGMFMYHTQPEGGEVIPNPDYPYLRRYVLPMIQSANSEKQQLVIFANLHDEIAALLAAKVPDPENPNISKTDLFQEFNFDYRKFSIDGIPMWGESTRKIAVTQFTKGGDFGAVKMLRGVAKIEVAVGANSDYTQANGVSNFKMCFVEVYNPLGKGAAVPYATAGYADGKVAYPSIPANPGVPAGLTFLGNMNISYGAPGFPYLHTGPYYVVEADNKNATNSKRTFVVIGGYYTEQGQPENTTVKTYYRIDLYDRANPEQTLVKYLDVLRGHRYMININGAAGPGYPTPEEAASSVTTKLNATVLVWNSKGIPTDATGEYTLRVNPQELNFNGMQRGDLDTNNKVGVFTDWGQGWKVTKITDVTGGTETTNPLWLSVDRTAGAPYVTTTMSVNVAAYDSAVPRYGRIYIEAGKWTYILNVMQKLGEIDVYPKDIKIDFDYRQVPLADMTLNIDTDFGWKVKKITDLQDNPVTWLSVFDPELADPLDIFDKTKDLAVNTIRSSDKAYLRADVNSGNAARTAKVTFSTEEGAEVRVTVTQGWIDCGAGGISKDKPFNNTTVRTHIYGGNIRAVGESLIKLGYFRRMMEQEIWRSYGDGSIRSEQKVIDYFTRIPYKYGYSCFMVENSNYGTKDYETNLSGKPGPFYSERNAPSACPEGWRLPVKADADNIHIPSDADYQFWLGYYASGYSGYWGESVYVEHMYYVSGIPQGAQNGRSLHIWGNRSAGVVKIVAIEKYSPAGNTAVDFYASQTDYNSLIPVRCVEDEDPYDYPLYMAK